MSSSDQAHRKWPRVRHINSYLAGTSLYYSLYRQLSAEGLEQAVFVPLRRTSLWQWSEEVDGIENHSARYQTPLDRVLFRRKIKKGLEAFREPFESRINAGDVVHAHTLFSDGALAYELSRRIGSSYIVAIRETDLNAFWKKMPHLRSYGQRVALGAARVVFLGPALRDRARVAFRSFWDQLEGRVEVIPNGIDDFWHRRRRLDERERNRAEIRVLFVGAFIRRKGIPDLVEAVRRLNARGVSARLRLVGARPGDEVEITSAEPWLEVLPFTTSRDDLAAHFDWADVFAMASRNETFGLVYAEALSQGVPVLYCEGGGFDGWCEDDSCGVAVPFGAVGEIASGLASVTKTADPEDCRRLSAPFRWDTIAARYLELYSSVVSVGSAPERAVEEHAKSR